METTSNNYRIYLDSCCICRPFDDQTEKRIQHETTSILQIISHFQSSEWQWINSGILRYEINQISELKKLTLVNALLNSIPQTDYVSVGKIEIMRGKRFEVLGFKEPDALHIACAESGMADIFLTTDDLVINKAKSVLSHLCVRVENPTKWLKKHLNNRS